MKKKLPKTDDRPAQPTPEDMVDRLLQYVRRHFYAHSDAPEKWFKDQHFIKRNVILWPAWFCCAQHGFTLPPERYEAIMTSVFQEVMHNGQTGAVRYWPGYLMKCVQEHWNHHWEDYYTEAKSLDHQLTAAVLAIKSVKEAAPAENKALEGLAIAHSVLTKKRHKTRPDAPVNRQLNLL